MAQAKRDTVAVVDDDEAVRDALRLLLEVVGHKVETFASAVEFLQAERSHIMCLVVDHHMPQMSGLDLVEHLQASGVKVPTILITGSLSPAIAARAAALGIEHVLDKPPGDEDLLAFIDLAKG